MRLTHQQHKRAPKHTKSHAELTSSTNVHIISDRSPMHSAICHTTWPTPRKDWFSYATLPHTMPLSMVNEVNSPTTQKECQNTQTRKVKQNSHRLRNCTSAPNTAQSTWTSTLTIPLGQLLVVGPVHLGRSLGSGLLDSLGSLLNRGSNSSRLLLSEESHNLSCGGADGIAHRRRGCG